jgi:hypothetical protein
MSREKLSIFVFITPFGPRCAAGILKKSVDFFKRTHNYP